MDKTQVKKILMLAFVIFAAFFVGIMMGGSKSQQPISRNTKASESVTSASTSKTNAPAPNIVGTISSVQSVNSGNRTLIVTGLSEADYKAQTNAKQTLTEKKYLIIVTPTTKIVRAGNTVTVDDLVKNMKVAIYTTTDLVTAVIMEVQ